LLALEEHSIKSLMKLLDLDLGQTLPLLHGVFHALANDLILHVQILSHTLSPLSPVLCPLLGLIPLALRLTLREPCSIRMPAPLCS